MVRFDISYQNFNMTNESKLAKIVKDYEVKYDSEHHAWYCPIDKLEPFKRALARERITATIQIF